MLLNWNIRGDVYKISYVKYIILPKLIVHHSCITPKSVNIEPLRHYQNTSYILHPKLWI